MQLTYCLHYVTKFYNKMNMLDYTVIIYISYMYLKAGMTHFYRLALYNLVLALTDILLKSKLFTWWMSHGDMTDYGHVTIIGVLLGQIMVMSPS